MPLARSFLQFIVLCLAVTYLVFYGQRLLSGDFSVIVLIYVLSSLGVAIWLYRFRQREIRERAIVEERRHVHLSQVKAKPYTLKVEEKTRTLQTLREQYWRGELEEQNYKEQEKSLEAEISEMTALDEAVFEAKQVVLRELGRRGKVEVSRLMRETRDKAVLDEAIAELMEEGLLRPSGAERYSYNYSGFNKSVA